MNKVRLNHFILWCKGWYQPTKETNLIAQAQKALTLDGYMSINNPKAIALNYIDDLVKEGVIKPIKLLNWNEEISRYMHYYGFDYNTSLMYVIKYFFAFECDKLPLTPPVYSRDVYKLGFVGPKCMGNSYKMLNYKANKFFNKHS